MYGLGTVISEFLFPLLTKFFKRKVLLNFFSIFACFCYLIFLALGYLPFLPKNPLLIKSLGFLIFFSQGVLNMLIIVMLNNTIEYDELKFNERHDSIISTVRSFSAKLSGAINQGIVNLTLIVSGIYAISQNISELEVKSGAGEIIREEVLTSADSFIQSAKASQLFILRTGISLVPIAALLACLLIMNKYYKIDEEKYDEIIRQIKEGSQD
jgi:melibiose permease/lactose/raffinose/galactose permease